MVPNMTMVETQNAGNSFITVRGISQARNSEPSVAVLVDGVLETNPYEFDQELFDIQQIEVLKGPQGALYGRNAIGGAIIIRTEDPSDQFEGAREVGIGNGIVRARPGRRQRADRRGRYAQVPRVAQLLQHRRLSREHLSAPEGRSRIGTTRARLRLLWKPADELDAPTCGCYATASRRTAYYFVIPRDDEANPFSTFTTPPNANDVTSPIQVNNPGEDNRDMLDTALKLDYNTGLRHVYRR